MLPVHTPRRRSVEVLLAKVKDLSPRIATQLLVRGTASTLTGPSGPSASLSARAIRAVAESERLRRQMGVNPAPRRTKKKSVTAPTIAQTVVGKNGANGQHAQPLAEVELAAIAAT